MKKIVLVSLSNAMGMQLYCRQIANQLIKEYDVSIIVTKYFDEMDLYEDVHIYKYFTTKRPTLDRGLLNISSYRKSLKIIEKADVVHILNSHPSDIVLLFLSKCKNTVFTLHDPIPHSTNLLGKCRNIVDKIINKQVTKIILHAKMHLHNPMIKSIKEKCFYTPLASMNSNSHFYDIKRYNDFLFFGRIEEYKGIDNLIIAANELSKKRNDFTVTIAGKGDLTKYSNIINKNKIFEIKNYVIPEEEIELLFTNTTFCVLPYISASQSGVIPLSYYYSRPVIITNIESLRENIELNKTGILICKDYTLEDIMSDILDGNYNIKEMAISAHEFGNDKLSMEIMCKNLSKLYFDKTFKNHGDKL